MEANNHAVYTGPLLGGITKVAEITGRSKYSIRRDIHDGKIAYVRSGQRLLVHIPLLLDQIDKEARGTCGQSE